MVASCVEDGGWWLVDGGCSWILAPKQTNKEEI